MLALWVVTLCSNITSSLDEMSSSVFGTFRKAFAMKSQFDACFYSKFTLTVFLGTNKSGMAIENSVFEAHLESFVAGNSTSTAINRALGSAEEM